MKNVTKEEVLEYIDSILKRSIDKGEGTVPLEEVLSIRGKIALLRDTKKVIRKKPRLSVEEVE